MDDQTAPAAQPAEIAAPSPVSVDVGDDFDRDRLLDLVDRLERDVALVEGAMNDIENGDQAGVDAALAALGGH